MKLQPTKDYLLLTDEEAEIKINDLCYNSIKNTWNDDVILYQASMPKYHFIGFEKIIAYYPLTKEAKELDLPLLPNPFEGEAAVEKFADDISNSLYDEERYYKYPEIKAKIRVSYIAGYKAQAKQFTIEDMKRAIRYGFDVGFCSNNGNKTKNNLPSENKFIQSLSTQQLPKEFIPEYEEYFDQHAEPGSDWGHKSIKTRFKTITNLEGKEVLVGEYKY